MNASGKTTRNASSRAGNFRRCVRRGAERNGQFIAEHTFRHGMHLSERLMGHIDSLLKEADATLADVARLQSASGRDRLRERASA